MAKETTKDSKGRRLYKGESQMSDGRYRYRYLDKSGKRISVYSWKLISTDRTPSGKKDDLCLRDKISTTTPNLQDGIRTELQDITVNEMLNRYLATKTTLAISTRGNYEHIWEKHIKNDMFGRQSIKSVKRSDVLAFYAHLHNNCHLKNGSIQLFQNFLYPAFQMMVDDSVIRQNPCRNCMKDYTGRDSEERVPLSLIEEQRLVEFLKNESVYYKRYYTMISFMLGTGTRLGETLGLTWDMVDLKSKTIKISRQLIHRKVNGKFQFLITPPKGKDTRIIPISDSLCKLLHAHKEDTYMLSMNSGCDVDGVNGFVFINTKNCVNTPNVVVKAFGGMVEEYAKIHPDSPLPKFSPHVLRHTFCTRMAENGMDIKVLQEIMGHKNISVTMQIYNHVDLARSSAEVERIAKIMMTS